MQPEQIVGGYTLETLGVCGLRGAMSPWDSCDYFWCLLWHWNFGSTIVNNHHKLSHWLTLRSMVLGSFLSPEAHLSFCFSARGQQPTLIRIYLIYLFVHLFIGSTGVRTQAGFELARQLLYHLSHTPSPFCFSYFSSSVCIFAQGQPGPRCAYLLLLHSWDHRPAPPYPAD
jgi:hypothetical protein